MASTPRLDRYRGGIPVYRYVPEPETPPVRVLRFHHEDLGQARHHPHIHDFPALLYVERGDVAEWVDERRPEDREAATDRAADRGRAVADGTEWRMRAGDLYLVAPGNVVRPPEAVFRRAGATAVFFAPEALGQDTFAPLSWRSHPLLFPFVHGRSTGLLRLRVPADERPELSRLITALETELAQRRDGYREAALAHLTLLLVTVARLATDLVGDLQRSNEWLLAEVFAVIERRYPERLSLRDVASAVNLTPGHLTTAVRRRTGRTVQDWILDRRMRQARELLTDTDLPVGEVGGRVGLPDPGYFARTFRREHGLSPRQWRAAAEGTPNGRPPVEAQPADSVDPVA